MTIALILLQIPTFLVKSYVWTDPNQGRSIPVRVTYPKNGKNLPVIVFSHGFRGSETSMDPLTEYWSKNGYVIFQPRHEDSAQNLQGAEKLSAFKTDANSFKSWRSRLNDCEFLYSVCQTIDKWVPGLTGRIDSKTILQAGHSFGAHTTQTLGGTTLANRSFASLKPIAFCCISPQGVGQGRTEKSWSEFTRPLLVISGTEDRSPLDDERTQTDPSARQDPYKFSPPGDKFLLWIEGANHNFGGISGLFNWPGAGKPNKQHVEWVQLTTLAFFDAYAKHDKSKLAWLKSNELTKQSSGLAKLTNR